MDFTLRFLLRSIIIGYCGQFVLFKAKNTISNGFSILDESLMELLSVKKKLILNHCKKKIYMYMNGVVS